MGTQWNGMQRYESAMMIPNECHIVGDNLKIKTERNIRKEWKNRVSLYRIIFELAKDLIALGIWTLKEWAKSKFEFF